MYRPKATLDFAKMRIGQAYDKFGILPILAICLVVVTAVAGFLRTQKEEMVHGQTLIIAIEGTDVEWKLVGPMPKEPADQIRKAIEKGIAETFITKKQSEKLTLCEWERIGENTVRITYCLPIEDMKTLNK